MEIRVDDAAPPVALDQSVPQNNTTEQLRLKIPNDIRTVGQYTYLELVSGEDSYKKLSSGSRSQTRNIAVFDMKSGTTSWVFENSAQEIEAFSAITKNQKNPSGKSIVVTTGFILKVATSRADGSIHRKLWVMSPSGDNLKTLLSDVPSKHSIKQFGENQTQLIFEHGNRIDAYPFDVDTLSVEQPVTITVPKK